ncbi:DUF1977-domain-containing protein [Xylariaceae sp. FL0804]|nr:DUF1977-domain-containing protein [Xylariaceae sp. FL0804]
MSSGKASGADAGSGAGSARSRDHQQGNQERKYTAAQKAAVLRIRRCGATAYYEVLELERSCSEGDIKKAYRKQSLLTHPDKNGHEQAAEAFKMVANAFRVLGDKDKRDKFDRFGTDPDSRFESARAQAGGGGGGGGMFRGGAGGARPGFGGGGRGMWNEDEISPEEMFQRFFGGAFGGPFGGGGFDTGPQFVFNMGGDRGFRVHQFGGGIPRRRPRGDQQQPQQPPQPQTAWDTFVGLLPVLFLFLMPLLTSLLSGGGDAAQPAVPTMVFDHAAPPQTLHRHTHKLGVDYFVDPADVAGWGEPQWRALDREAEAGLVRALRRACQAERQAQHDLVQQAQGWFFPDQEKLRVARDLPLAHCRRLDDMRVGR